MLPYLLALACAIALSTGQILFKACANEMARHGGPTLAAAAYLLVAMLIYGVTSLAWVWLLRSVELGKVYPFMALAFVLVPLGSHSMIVGRK